ncbi:MAG: cytochrome C oxidase subunit IV family protein [Candidatus Marinimicrobia bacterium]|nr:cytochrome C oxidase subunit IV family protein [Candidatus Neomarinimicrobiota bacterium]
MSTVKTSHHIIPFKVYITVFAALLILTGITVAVSFVDLGAYNMVVALFVAGVKASLVAMFFMHLLYDSKLNLAIFLGSILFLVIFIVFTMFDTMTRDNLYEIKSGEINKQGIIYKDLPKNGTGSDH